jgi:hypothetical protein
MPRENARLKADRLLLEGRLIIDHVDHAHVRGEGHRWEATYTRPTWACTCPVRTDQRSHLIALRRVVAVER